VLNASDDHLWGIISNGFILRLLRDNLALTRQAYVEWDLQAIFDGDLYPEFFLLWVACHQSRFEVPPGGRPEQCWLEKWRKQAEDTGLRALENLRPGVEQAIAVLGTGLISHKSNQALRGKLSTGQLSTQDFYRQILRLIYRLLFLLVAEDRSLLHPPLPSEEDGKDALEKAIQARRRYDEFYSISRLRFLTRRRAGTPHPDLWQIFQFVTVKLGSDAGCPELALPALGSFLWNAESTQDLNQCLVSNRHFLEAVHSLAYIRDGDVRRIIDYKNLGSEELGSVYESLLELHPIVNADIGTFELQTAAGHERKTSGSYYTPDSLVQCLLDSALEPVIANAIKGKEGEAPVDALLKLKICDPAVGSGHFLIAAAHRLAKRVAAARTGEEEPSPEATRTALRDVIGRCLYGVDINPMAAELCKISLWLEALEPGKPLSFLDHHVRIGNSLIGAMPEHILEGLPDDAYKPLEGDDKKVCSDLKKLNKAERKGFGPLFAQQDAETLAHFQRASALLEDLPEDRVEDIHAKELAFRDYEETEEYRNKKQLADVWCSAFVINKCLRTPGCDIASSGITQGQLNALANRQKFNDVLAAEVSRLSLEYKFFHWYLAFPEVIAKGGFDCVIGNPPWEKIQPEERQFFITIRPDIALATGAERKRLIAALMQSDAHLWSEWNRYRLSFDRFSHFIRASKLYPLSAVGNLNTSTLFLDLAAKRTNSAGQVGMIIPSGIATNEITSDFFQSLVRSGRIRSLFDFENGQSMFPDVDSRFRFCLIVISGSSLTRYNADFSFFRKSIEELNDPTSHFTLAYQDFELLSPNTGTCPTFSNVADAEITKAIHRRVPAFIQDKPTESNPWHTKIYAEMYNMTRASHLFHTTEDLLGKGAQQENSALHHGSDVYLPIYEARMLGIYDHRLCSVGINPKNVFRGAVSETTTIDEHGMPDHYAAPRYWLSLDDFQNEILNEYDKRWFSGFRMVTASTNERTMIAAIFPRTPFVNTISGLFNNFPAAENTLLIANLSSFILDYTARQRISGVSLNFFVAKQLPIIPPELYSDKAFIVLRVLELVFTSWDLQPFAEDCGWFGPPFRWEEDRRFLLRCELDAAFFHLYLPAEENGEWRMANKKDGSPYDETPEQLAELKKHFPTPREAVAYIMDTFPIVRRKDEEKNDGDFRTKRIILEIYDAMQESIRTGQPYQTRLDPPPADPRCCHPPKEIRIIKENLNGL